MERIARRERAEAHLVAPWCDSARGARSGSPQKNNNLLTLEAAKKMYLCACFKLYKKKLPIMFKFFVLQAFCLAVLALSPSVLLGQCVGTTGLNLYWVGVNGTGNFNDPNNWRVGSVGGTQSPCQSPRSTDNVYFTAAAFPVAAATITIDQNSNCFNMLWDNTIGTAPSLAGTTDKVLEIYGNMVLPAIGSHNFNYRGELVFKGVGSNTYLLDTKGHNLRVADFRINLDPLATLQLQSTLLVNNYNNNNVSNSYGRTGGIIYHQTGHFNTNAQLVDADGFHSNNGNTTRKITFDGSKINLAGRGWYPDLFSLDNIPAANFSATGSHITIAEAAGAGLTESLEFTATALLDSITINTARGRGNWTGKINANYMLVTGRTTAWSANFEVNTLVLEDGAVLVLNGGEVACDVFVGPSGCAQAATIQSNSTTTPYFIRKKTAGNLVMNNVLLKFVQGNTTGGRTYTANSSFDGGNNVNIAITAPVGCPSDLYFRNTVSDNWHDIQNWYDAGGVQVMMLPSPATNVFFNNLSGATRVLVNQNVAYCNNMTWLPTVTAGIRLQLDQSVYVLGDITFNSNMSQISGTNSGYELVSGLGLYGVGKTFTSASIPISIGINMASGSDYTIADSMYCGAINMHSGSTIRATNVGISLTRFAMANRIMDNARVHTRGGGWPLIHQYGYTVSTYLNNCIFYINDVAPLTAQTIGAVLPNVVLNSQGDIQLNSNIQGDLTILRSANLAFRSGNETTRLTVQGNVNLASGIEVVFSGLSTADYVRVGGDLTAIGSCSQPTTIRTHNGNPIEFRVSGTANINTAFLKGLNSTFPITAINSIDGTSNTNITFTTGGGTTFYWRAKSSNPTNFVGNWSDPQHWTINPASTVGDNACIPSLADDVVFDALSRSATSNGCTIDGQAYCRNITATNNININCATIDKVWYVGGSFDIANTVQIQNYRGYIYMIGAGNFTFNTNGLALRSRELVFDNPAGRWTLLSPLELDDAFNSTFSGRMLLNAGTFDANGNNIRIHNGFISEINKPRTLIFTGATITILMSGTYQTSSGVYNRPWSITSPASMNLQAGTLSFLDGSNSTEIDIRFGDNLNYQVVNITEAAQNLAIRNNANIQYANFNSSLYFYDNMAFDSIAFYGGKTYIFAPNKTQTLRAPHGKIISNGTSSSFVNLQSATIGSKAYFYKDYGDGFCIDFLKVQDVIALRQNNIALVPAPYDVTHVASLFFDTGNNCDNINGSATDDPNSIWRFNLQPLVTPQYAGANVVQVCALTAPASFTIPVTGTSPYVITYTWVSGAANGSSFVNATDDDNNTATPFDVTIPINTTNPNITYTFNVTTFRCGEQTIPIPATITVQQPSANVLTAAAQTSTCIFNNSPDWRTMVGSSNNRPILSLLDYTGAGDVVALGSVTSNVAFDATVQQVNIGGTMYPYLQRNWRITPTNNGAAFVRLYFTQAELAALAAANTYTGSYTGALSAANDIQVVKYASGTIGVGAPQIIPHSVIVLAGANAIAFSSTTNVIAIEFYVPSFSAFIITPTMEALLPLQLTRFEAQRTASRKVQIDWAVAKSIDIDYFEVQRSADTQNPYTIATATSLRRDSEDAYTIFDENPLTGYNYYRLRSVNTDGTIGYSQWKAVEFNNDGNTISLAPNPAENAVRIQMSQAAAVNVRVYNQLGQLATIQNFAAADNSHTLDISALPAGVYTVQVLHGDNAVSSLRLVKN
jgi:hypothetical protein